jgi:hypothetical protein
VTYLRPDPPFLTRQRLRLRTQRRNLRYWTARQLRRLVHRLDPLPRGADRHPSPAPRIVVNVDPDPPEVIEFRRRLR